MRPAISNRELIRDAKASGVRYAVEYHALVCRMAIEQDRPRPRYRGPSLVSAYIQGASLECVNLRGVDLSFARLHDCDLRWADFTNANLHCADLAGSTLRSARFDGAREFNQIGVRGVIIAKYRELPDDCRGYGCVCRRCHATRRALGKSS